MDENRGRRDVFLCLRGGLGEGEGFYLFEQLPKTQRDHALGAFLVRSAGVAWREGLDPHATSPASADQNTRHIKARNAQPARRPRHPYQLLQHHIRHLLPPRPSAPDRLIPHRIDGPIYHPAIPLHNHLHGIPLCEIHSHASDLLRDGQPLRHAVDDVDGGGAAQGGAVCGHEADGAGAEDGDALAGLEAG